MQIFLLAFMILSLFCYQANGRMAFSLFRYFSAQKLTLHCEGSLATLVGLLISLTLTFFLWHCGVPLWLATILPLLLPLFAVRSVKESVYAIFNRRIVHLNLLLWCIAIIYLGTTIVLYDGGIKTIWTNNYGDVTFHIGMLNSFIFGNNTLPEYHLFAGQRLSYPFFVNLWTASYWWIDPQFKTVPLVFAFQWSVVWILVFHFLKGRDFWLMPWCVLLAGGSFMHLGENSGQLIPHNVPWTSFLTTIWVPQRSALFGVAALCGALTLLHAAQSNGAYNRYVLLLAALVMSLQPLVHTHFFLVAVVYGAGLLIFRFISSGFKREEFVDGVYFARGLLPALIFTPWIVGKSGMIKPVLGWVTGAAEHSAQRLSDSILMWITPGTALVWLILVLALWIVTRCHRQFLVLALLFMLGNFVQLAIWDWDQIKFFLGLLIVSIAVWTTLERKGVWLLHCACVLMTLPTLCELPKILLKKDPFTVYSAEDVQRALAIRAETPADAVLVGNPIHNSVGTLTGRRLFYGYEGTLSSHGLAYAGRQRIMSTLDLLRHCRKEIRGELSSCPNFLLWGYYDQEYFKRQTPGAGFEATALPYLFRIP